EVVGGGMGGEESLAGGGNVDGGVSLGGDLPEPSADEHDEIGAFDAGNELRIGPDAEIAGVTGMLGVEQMGAAERGGDRQREALGEARECGAGGGRPAGGARAHDR